MNINKLIRSLLSGALPRKLCEAADFDMRDLERQASTGDVVAMVKYDAEMTRRGRPIFTYWNQRLRRDPSNDVLRALWLNAGVREDKETYRVSIVRTTESHIPEQHIVRGTRNDREVADLGTYDNESDAHEAGSSWVRDQEQSKTSSRITYDYEITVNDGHFDREDDEIVNTAMTLEELLYELNNRYVLQRALLHGSPGTWESDWSTDWATRGQPEEKDTVSVRYIIPLRPGYGGSGSKKFLTLLNDDFDRIDNAIKNHHSRIEQLGKDRFIEPFTAK